MKTKVLSLAGVAALMVALGACSNKQCTKTAVVSDDDEQYYTAVLPAADADGVRTTLIVDLDDDDNDGDFELIQTFFNVDSTGVSDIASFVTEGDLTYTKTADGKLNLTLKAPTGETMYFVAATDSTMVMTDASFVPTETPGMNYTLVKAKK